MRLKCKPVSGIVSLACVFFISSELKAQTDNGAPIGSAAIEKIDRRLRAIESPAQVVPVFIRLNNQPQHEIVERAYARNAVRLQQAQTRYGMLAGRTAVDAGELRQAANELDAAIVETRHEAFREIQSAIAAQQDAMERRLRGLGASNLGRYSFVNMLTAEVPAAALSALEADPDIAEVAAVDFQHGPMRALPFRREQTSEGNPVLQDDRRLRRSYRIALEQQRPVTGHRNVNQ